MPITRDPRANRRRRVLRDGGADGNADARARAGDRGGQDETAEESAPRRSAGYSQEVRRACGQRLVQFIPVRKVSFSGLVLVSLAIPALLLTGHYMIYVSGSLKWYGHPLAVALDASHQSSIAAWFSSHLWLMCLGATLLTFQLRRHKLDDYNGEYRLWFWLVLTCLAASVDSTTHISELFGLALDRWAQINLGWSGPAVVNATLAVLVGLLGLRLCSELKSVPLSLVFWLGGLAAWAGSAALAQEELRLEMSLQWRIWLKASLWLGGLTAIWLAALSYLRNVYIEAQRRFLARGALATNGVGLMERFQRGARGSQPQTSDRDTNNDDVQATKSPRGATTRRAAKAAATAEDSASATAQSRNVQRKSQQRDAKGSDQSPDSATGVRSRWNPFARRSAAEEAPADAQSKQESARARQASKAAPSDGEDDEGRATGRGLAGWLRKPKDDDDAQEFQKVKPNPNSRRTSGKQDEGGSPADSEGSSTKPRRGWFSRKPQSTEATTEPAGASRPGSGERAASPAAEDGEKPSKSRWFQRKAKQDDDAAPSAEDRPKRRGLLSRFKLQPPEDSQEATEQKSSQSAMREVKGSAALPNTHASSNSSAKPEDSGAERPLTKAERKRLRRQQRQNRAA